MLVVKIAGRHSLNYPPSLLFVERLVRIKNLFHAGYSKTIEGGVHFEVNIKNLRSCRVDRFKVGPRTQKYNFFAHKCFGLRQLPGIHEPHVSSALSHKLQPLPSEFH